MTFQIQLKWFRRKRRSFAKWLFSRLKFHSDYSEFSNGHNFLSPLWNFNFSDSLERYSQIDSNIFGFTKIRFILNPVHSFEIWNRIFKLPRHFQLLLKLKINIYILTSIQINVYVLILFKITSLLFKIIHFKYSKFIKISKIIFLNWFRFSRLLQPLGSQEI